MNTKLFQLLYITTYFKNSTSVRCIGVELTLRACEEEVDPAGYTPFISCDELLKHMVHGSSSVLRFFLQGGGVEGGSGSLPFLLSYKHPGPI